MSDIATHIALDIAVLASLLVGPALAILFLGMRKRRSRAERRSPIGIDLLRGPGHTVREQLDEAINDLSGDVLGLCIAPLVLLSLFLGQTALRGLTQSAHLAPFYVGVGVLAVGTMVWRLVRAGERLDRLKAGFDAELAVGQELDQLMRQGAFVYHDFPCEGFNIDHVVIAAAGVFAVETKGYRKQTKLKGREAARVTYNGLTLAFPTWTTSKPIEQAESQAKWLATWATSAVGEPVNVAPIVALPGWFVQRTGRSSVLVLSGGELSGLLDARTGRPLSAQEVQRVVHQVEQRCRTVIPTLRRTESPKH